MPQVSYPHIREFFWILLLPLSFLWAGITRARRRWFSLYATQVAPVPVLCVGNLHSGGTGKTPLVESLVHHFRGASPVILTRGYRSKMQRSSARLDLRAPDRVARYGDEAVMLARRCDVPVYVGGNRGRSAIRACKELGERCGLFVMDDGFQNFTLHKDVSLILVPVHLRPRDGFCLPLGDLREPWSAIREAQGIVLTGSGGLEDTSWKIAEWKAFLGNLFPHLPVFTVLSKLVWPWTELKRRRLGAFCGLGNPDVFFDELRAFAPLELTLALPDHQSPDARDWAWLEAQGKEKGITDWLTTEKDVVKLAEGEFETAGKPVPSPLSSPLWCVSKDYTVDSRLTDFLREALSKTQLRSNSFRNGDGGQ